MNSHSITCCGYEIAMDSVEGLGDRLHKLRCGGKTVLITDSNVDKLHSAKVEQVLKAAGFGVLKLVIASGEQSKSFAQFVSLCEQILEWKIERTDTIVALGGGVVGDLSGYVAASLLRGVKLVHLPTTLLAQVDSAIGGKTGINAKAGKNLVGSFYRPTLVLADATFLETLSPQEMLNGYAEVVKYGLIGDGQGNGEFFESLEKTPPVGSQNGFDRAAVLQATILRAMKFKADIVNRDEKEQNIRALLNLGHTFGHGLEATSGYKLAHGKAVAAGLAAAFAFSAHLGLCDAHHSNRVLTHLNEVGFDTSFAIAGKVSAGGLMEFMSRDKKNTKGRITLILAKAIGKAFVAEGVDRTELEKWLGGYINK